MLTTPRTNCARNRVPPIYSSSSPDTQLPRIVTCIPVECPTAGCRTGCRVVLRPRQGADEVHADGVPGPEVRVSGWRPLTGLGGESSHTGQQRPCRTSTRARSFFSVSFTPTYPPVGVNLVLELLLNVSAVGQAEMPSVVYPLEVMRL
jgi:hypothetical protein